MHANCCLRFSWGQHEFFEQALASKLGTVGVGFEEASAIWHFTAAIRRLQT